MRDSGDRHVASDGALLQYLHNDCKGHVHVRANCDDCDNCGEPVTDRDVPCVCGNRGCLNAVAGGAALARDLATAGLPVQTTHDVAPVSSPRRHPPPIEVMMRMAMTKSRTFIPCADRPPAGGRR